MKLDKNKKPILTHGFKKGDLVMHVLWKNQLGIVISACDESWRDEYDEMLTVEWITEEGVHGQAKYVPPHSIAKADQWHLRRLWNNES